MGALAALLQDLGWQVTGSDGPLYPPMSTFLASRRIPLAEGYAPENVRGERWGIAKARPDLVVIGNAISRSNVEAQAVEACVAEGTRRMSFAQALAEFCIDDRRSFVVAGTHGKTTTSSVLAWCLESLGRQPGFFVGGIPKNFGQGCRVAEGRDFVSEGDEYDTAYWDKGSKFLHYRPSWVLCTGIEFDHADIFADLSAVEASFLKLVDKTREGWILVDDEASPSPASVARVAARVKEAGQRLWRYGAMAGSELRLHGIESVELPWDRSVRGARLDLETPTLGRFRVDSPLIGRHNALNLLGVVGTLLAGEVLKDVASLQEALRGFRGVKRRQEEVFVSPGLVVIDDFAHHPTAIRETIAAIRSRYAGARVAAFFEPRSATSARKVLEKEFSESFDGADAVFLVPPTKANVPEAERLDAKAVLATWSSKAANRAKFGLADPSIETLAQRFDEWRRGDSSRAVALVMSNGPFGGLHGRLATLGS